MSEQKIYCGSGKERTFQDGGSLISITVDIETLQRAFKEHGFTSTQGKKKMKLDISKRREVDQYGNSHSVSVNTWKPDQQNTNNSFQPASPKDQSRFDSYQPPEKPIEMPEDDIPF